MKRTFSSLRHRDYRLFWAAMLVSNIGTWMQRVAQDWLVLVVLDGGARSVGIVTGLQFLPFLLVAPLGGVLADRLPKRALLLATNAFMGATGLALGILVLTDTARIWHVCVLAFLLGVGSALDAPARQALVGDLVDRPDLPNAIALNSASFNGARLLGPATAGLLIGLVGTGWVFVINAVTFAAPLVALSLLRSAAGQAGQDTEDPSGTLARLRAGLAYARSRPDLLMVFVIAFGVGTFGMNFQMTTALMAAEVYQRGPGEYGLLGTIMAAGTLSGALLAARRAAPTPALVAGSALAFGVCEVASGLMPSYVWFAVSLVPIGLAVMTVLTAANTYLQTTVPPEMRGRVLALYMMILKGGTPVGAPVIGWVAESFGARWSLLGGGALTLVTVVVAVAALAARADLSPRLRPLPARAS